jgi:CarD family transcriptional regulator
LAEKIRASTKTAAKARAGVKKSTAAGSKATAKTASERSRIEKLRASAAAATRKIAGKTRQVKTAKTHQQAKSQDKKSQDNKAAIAVVAPKSTPARAPSPPAKTVFVAKAAPIAASGKATESRTPAASESTQVANKAPEKAPEKAPLAVPPAPAKPVHPAPSAGPVDAKSAAPAKAVVKAKATAHRLGFKLNEFVVYPAHGVGQITGVDIQEVAGFSLELFVVSFIKDKMILKVPTSKVTSVGMRKLAETEVVDKALGTLSGRARVKRTMWSRRAQEYEAKINSGDLVTIAEVVRDLYRSDTQPEQSYSERQLYEAALERMGREIVAVRKLIDSEALALIESFLLKGPKRGPKNDADIAADIAADGADPADVVRAA